MKLKEIAIVGALIAVLIIGGSYIAAGLDSYKQEVVATPEQGRWF